MTTLTTLAVLIVGAAACATDIHSRRIPNWLTFGATALAIATQLATNGPAGVQTAMTGWVTGLLLFLPLFLLGGMGAGDVKLLAALGAWLGPGATLWLAIYASLAGGLMAVVVSLRHNYLAKALSNLGALSQFWWFFGMRPMPGLTLESTASPRLAYAVPMFLGTVVTLWLR